MIMIIKIMIMIILIMIIMIILIILIIINYSYNKIYKNNNQLIIKNIHYNNWNSWIRNKFINYPIHIK